MIEETATKKNNMEAMKKRKLTEDAGVSRDAKTPRRSKILFPLASSRASRRTPREPARTTRARELADILIRGNDPVDALKVWIERYKNCQVDVLPPGWGEETCSITPLFFVVKNGEYGCAKLMLGLCGRKSRLGESMRKQLWHYHGEASLIGEAREVDANDEDIRGEGCETLVELLKKAMEAARRLEAE